MGNRKQPTPPPTNQRKPDPPPAPPAPRVRVSYGSCELYCTSPMQCPLCKLLIPANTPHSCVQKGSSRND